MNDRLGKEAENRIKQWLDRPMQGYCFDRLPDQMTGFYGSRNICDFTLFKSPNFYYIESKATWNDRFDFKMITEFQMKHMLEKSLISGVISIVIVLFATHQRAFILPIQEIDQLISNGIKSLNITKIDKWNCKYIEIPTIPSKKKLLVYTSDIEILIKRLYENENN